MDGTADSNVIVFTGCLLVLAVNVGIVTRMASIAYADPEYWEAAGLSLRWDVVKLP